MGRKFTVIITKGDIAYVSYCPELGIASQGKSIPEAKKNLKEAAELYLEEAEHSDIVKSKVPLITTLIVGKR